MTDVIRRARSRDLTPPEWLGGVDLELSDKIAFLMRMKELGARGVMTPDLAGEIASGLADQFMSLEDLERVSKAITADNSFTELVPRNGAFAGLFCNIVAISLDGDIYSQMAERMSDFKLFSLPEGASLSMTGALPSTSENTGASDDGIYDAAHFDDQRGPGRAVQRPSAESTAGSQGRGSPSHYSG